MRPAGILLALLILFALVSLSTVGVQRVDAVGPKALKTFTGSLDPGAITDPPLSWELGRDVSDFLFHYSVTGGSDMNDVVYVSIDGIPFDYLMGDGWAYCDCPMSAGPYSVTVEADGAATGRLAYDIGFYAVPQPPVNFEGYIPANSSTRSNDFAILLPSQASSQVNLGVSGGGDYGFFVDGESKGVVTTAQQIQIDFTSGFHLLEIWAGEGDVRWSIEILGPPKLEVTIANDCPTLNPESSQSVCVTGAEVTASDGGSPVVSYMWKASGGSFNSTTSQWVEWTAPPGVASFTLSVNASAPGYVSGTDTINVQVVPEFPSAAVPILFTVGIAVVFFARRLGS